MPNIAGAASCSAVAPTFDCLACGREIQPSVEGTAGHDPPRRAARGSSCRTQSRDQPKLFCFLADLMHHPPEHARVLRERIPKVDGCPEAFNVHCRPGLARV